MLREVCQGLMMGGVASAVLLVATQKGGDQRLPARGYHRLDYKEVVDGDTLRDVVIRLPWGVSVRGDSLRLTGFDAWERTRARRSVSVTDDELAKGQEAAIALASLLQSAQDVWAVPADEEYDTYGRLLAGVWVRDRAGKMIEVAPWMKRRGHCRPDGGK